MTDLYATLEVPKTASGEEIRAAYRRLAKVNHPDLNPGNKAAEQKFKAISAAYEILGDPEKRRRYDAGEIDESGAEREPERRFYRQYAESGPSFRYETAGFDDLDDLGGIFSDAFRRSRAHSDGSATGFRARGADSRYRLVIDFIEAANGAKKRIELPNGRSLDVTIPPGAAQGQVLRLAGMGAPGIGGGSAGDALIELDVRQHPVFRRDGNDIRSVVPVTLKEAIAGGSIRVETISGPVDVRVPKSSNSGTVLRLRGRGVAGSEGQRGDHLVELRIMLPENSDAELERIVSDWETRHPYKPRREPGGAP
jgi:DnaJ-class molecular chaperone